MNKTRLFIAVALATFAIQGYAQLVVPPTAPNSTNLITNGNIGIQNSPSGTSTTPTNPLTIGYYNSSATSTTPTTKVLVEEDNPWIELKDNSGYSSGGGGFQGASIGIKFTTPGGASPYSLSYEGSNGPMMSLQNVTTGLGYHVRGGNSLFMGFTSGAGIQLNTSSIRITMPVLFDNAATVRIGTSTFPTDNQFMLIVGTGIITEKIKVATAGSANWSWPDFVFSKNHNLISLDSVETYIKANNHLPSIPSAQEVAANGIDLAEMDAKLLQKIEEMTLYMIEVKKEVEALKKENQELKAKLK